MSKPDLQPYTVGVRDADGTGTTHVSCHEATSMEEAIEQAKAVTREDWGYDNDEPLHILCVLKGDVDVLHWDDLYD